MFKPSKPCHSLFWKMDSSFQLDPFPPLVGFFASANFGMVQKFSDTRQLPPYAIKHFVCSYGSEEVPFFRFASRSVLLFRKACIRLRFARSFRPPPFIGRSLSVTSVPFQKTTIAYGICDLRSRNFQVPEVSSRKLPSVRSFRPNVVF